MLLKVCVFFILVGHKTASGIRIIWDKNSVNDVSSIDEYELSKAEEIKINNGPLIFPGTKWCGAGNIAENYEDLGEHKETDKCCRTHDYCDDIIEAFQTKYNLTNSVFYTRLNCRCDKAFRKCLKDDASKPSLQIGQLYFTFLGTKCFSKDFPVIRCLRHTYIPWKKCIEYEFDDSQEKVYQWFDLRNF